MEIEESIDDKIKYELIKIKEYLLNGEPLDDEFIRIYQENRWSLYGRNKTRTSS